MAELRPLGDRGILARFATEAEAASWAAAVAQRNWAGVTDIVPAYDSVAVLADPERIELSWLEEQLRSLEPEALETEPRRLIQLPVLYEGEDLAEVATRCGLSEAEVITQHSGQEYQVFALGFLPGFPYAGYLPPSLTGLPRRKDPRLQVPAGSVAIVGKQTGIYPQESPAGWYLLGRTPLRIVDVSQEYFPILAGDRLRFEPISRAEFHSRRGEILS